MWTEGRAACLYANDSVGGGRERSWEVWGSTRDSHSSRILEWTKGNGMPLLLVSKQRSTLLTLKGLFENAIIHIRALISPDPHEINFISSFLTQLVLLSLPLISSHWAMFISSFPRISFLILWYFTVFFPNSELQPTNRMGNQSGR